MANVRDFFINAENSKIASSSSLETLGKQVESADYIKSKTNDINRFIPTVDFTTASNFSRYGSLEKYYKDAFYYVYSEYPYDGSHREKVEWELSGTYFDKYIFDELYPRTNGYINVGYDYGTVSPMAGKFSTPSNIEYIYFEGGPNAAPTTSPANTLKQQFTASNVYDSQTRQDYNIDINGDKGFSVEFWLKKDGWSSSDESRLQVITDLWNSGSYSTSESGRVIVYLNRTNPDRMYVHVRSGSVNNSFNIGSQLNITGNTWNHYALTFANVGSKLETKLYQNGSFKSIDRTADSIGEMTGSMVGQIGSLVADEGTMGSVQGSGKLSGSLDEYRLWKTTRTPEQVGRNWFTQVFGGTNTDYNTSGTGSAKYSPGNPVDLGVYYKFNEGVYDSGSADTTDETVLDYSGRATNGAWTGYTLGARSTNSAMVESSASLTEFKDPILYNTHPLVSNLENEYSISASLYDERNSSNIFKSLPGWIQEEDLENERGVLQDLTQILGSYFDTLHLQIEALPQLKDVEYLSSSSKPLPFINRAIDSMGFNVSELFTEASILEAYADRDNFRDYEDKLSDIKNRVYQNIYNNLVNILKSKGTEKSFRNLIRCYGIDEQLVKLNLYANNTTHLLRDNFETISLRKKYANFHREANTSAIVYQNSSSSDVTNTRSYIAGTTEMEYHGNTYQSEFIFPKMPELGTQEFYTPNFVSSSLFGCHTPPTDDPDVIMFDSEDLAGFTIQAIRVRNQNNQITNSAYFRLTGTLIPELTSSLFDNLYDNERWNVSLRIKPSTWPFAGSLSGTVSSSYDVEFNGYNAVSDDIINEFSLTSSLVHSLGKSFMNSSKKFFVGANRQDFTGSILQRSSVKASSLRAWMTYLPDQTLKAHTKDPTNYGVESLLRNAYSTEKGEDYGENVPIIPSIDTLALQWNFGTVTGSDSSGEFLVEDYSSGSLNDTTKLSWLGPVAKYKHPGRGDFFPASSTASISQEYVLAAQQQPPEVINSSNMIDLVGSNDDSLFTRESRPISYYFAVEKSPYAIVSDEMIKLFSTIVDFNNLIGQPVNRYRQEYKHLEKARQKFFEKMENSSVDFEKFVDYYKWFDTSISLTLTQLFPASADFSQRLRTLVESHVLERNKYWSKFPTIETHPRGTIHLSAPLKNVALRNSGSNNDKDRSTSDSSVNSDLEELNSQNQSGPSPRPGIPSHILAFTTAGQSYSPKASLFYGTKTLKESAKKSKEYSGGSNVENNRQPQFLKSSISAQGSSTQITINAADARNEKRPTPTEKPDPTAKTKLSYKMQNSQDPEGNISVASSIGGVFDLFEEDVETGYAKELSDNFKSQTQLSNYHNDFVTPEVPLQSPFTNKWVGGNQYRHADLNKVNSDGNLDTSETRAEAWSLSVASNAIILEARALALPRATLFRQTVAKRPVNIANIPYDTSSANIGNYSKNYEIFETNGRSTNNRFFIKAGGFLPITASIPVLNDDVVDFTLPRYDLTGSTKSIIVNRFSSPGAPEQTSLGALDVDAEEFSVYNELNNRNFIVRRSLNEWSTEHANNYGIKSGSSVNADNYNTNAAYYKVNRNPRIEAALTNGFEGDVTHSVDYDNFWVQHAIPQSAFQYVWITSSATRTPNSTYGYVSEFSVPSASTSTTQSSIPFILNSQISADGNVVDFVGMNTLIYDPLNTDTRTLGLSNTVYRNDAITSDLEEGNVLNALLLHRNGPYQYPSWKQTRTGQNPIARSQRNNNILSAFERGGEFSRYIADLSGQHNKFYKPFRSKTNFDLNSQCVTASLVEPPVSFKYKPLETTLIHQDSLGQETTLKHCYGNNLSTFANKQFDNITSYKICEPQQHDKIKKLYSGETPRAKVVDTLYREIIYPSDLNVGLAKTRGRLNYAEDLESVGANGIDRSILERRTFWRNSLTNRLRLTSSTRDPFPLNSMNFVDDGGINVWPLDNLVTSSSGLRNPDNYGGRNLYGGELIRYNNYLDTSLDKYHPITSPMFYLPSVSPSITQWNGINLTASQTYHYECMHTPSESAPQWVANKVAGKNPWFDSYEEYSNDIRSVAKDYTIIPEFRISEHIEYYVNQNGGDFRVENKKFLTLAGASYSSSAPSELSASSQSFYKTYSNSDFQKYFGKLSEDSEMNSISLKCNAVKKLLPYNGFYPMLRCSQVGSLLSQSVAPYIGGVNWKTGESIVKSSPSSPTIDAQLQKSGTLAVQSLMQPFFAPGIMYNSIKSGIAVDYPVYTGSAYGEITDPNIYYPYGSTVAYDWNYRIPFEAMVNFKEHIPVSSSTGENKISLINTQRPNSTVVGAGSGRNPYFDWSGDIDPNFEMSTNNFFAETADFFLEGGEFSSISSQPQKDFKAMIPGKTYYMDVYLDMPKEIVDAQRDPSKTINEPVNPNHTVMFEGFYSFKRQTYLGYDITVGDDPRRQTYRGRWFGPTSQQTSSAALTANSNMMLQADPAPAPFTPPYYYGRSIATIAYTATGQEQSGSNLLDTILSNATITYSNPNLTAFSSSVASDGSYASGLAYRHAMMLSSSINLLGKTRTKKVEYDLGSQDNSKFVPTKAVDSENNENNVWVISSKFETPVLNFIDSWFDYPPGEDKYEMPVGMWATYGKLCKGGEGLWFGIEETYGGLPVGPGASQQGTTDMTGSLMEVCGFDKTSKRQRIGKVAKQKTISEAIVAIPYVEDTGTTRDSSVCAITKEKISDKNLLSLFGNSKAHSRKLFNTINNNLKNGNLPLQDAGFEGKEQVQETSVSDMIEKLNNYVIPPEMNFLTYDDIEPFVMYIMEFEHTLDQQDLADVWQGLMPKISQTAEKDSAEITHTLDPWEFLGGKKLPDQVRWMVFKLKKKAKINYFEKTADSTDDDRFKFNFKVGEKTPEYSYNWPYDFCSLVELAQIETTDEFVPPKKKKGK